MSRYHLGVLLSISLCVGIGAAWAGDDLNQFNQSWQALRTGPLSTTYLSSSGGQVETFSTGPHSSYFIATDRHGHTTASGTIYSAPTYDASSSLPAWQPPVDTLLQDPLADPLGLGHPDHWRR
jgi:hypothetical protein